MAAIPAFGVDASFGQGTEAERLAAPLSVQRWLTTTDEPNTELHGVRYRIGEFGWEVDLAVDYAQDIDRIRSDLYAPKYETLTSDEIIALTAGQRVEGSDGEVYKLAVNAINIRHTEVADTAARDALVAEHGDVVLVTGDGEYYRDTRPATPVWTAWDGSSDIPANPEIDPVAGNSSWRDVESMQVSSKLLTKSTIADIKQVNPGFQQYTHLSESRKEGEFKWLEGDYTLQVARDTYEMGFIESDIVTADQGVWARQRIYDSVQLEWGYQGTDWQTVLTLATKIRLAFGEGTILQLPAKEFLKTTSPSPAPASISIRGSGVGKTIVKSDFVGANPLIQSLADSEGFSVSELTLDGNDGQHTGVLAYFNGIQGLKLDNLEFKGWRRAFQVLSSVNQGWRDVDIRNVEVNTPSTIGGVGQPCILEAKIGTLSDPALATPEGQGFYIDNLNMELPPGGFTSNPSNLATGDALALKRARDGEVKNSRIYGSGELAFAAGREVVNATFDNCTAIASDADGFGIGTGHTMATMTDVSGYVDGEIVDIGLTGVIGTIDGIVPLDGGLTDLYLKNVGMVSTSEFPVAGDLIVGRTSLTSRACTEYRVGVRNTNLKNCVGYGNGLDALATGNDYAGHKHNNTDNCSVIDCNFDEISEVPSQAHASYLINNKNIALINISGQGVTGSESLVTGVNRFKRLSSSTPSGLGANINIVDDSIKVPNTHAAHQVVVESGTSDVINDVQFYGAKDGDRVTINPSSNDRIIRIEGTGGNVRLDGGPLTMAIRWASITFEYKTGFVNVVAVSPAVIHELEIFADDVAAASLQSGQQYQTATGELRIKL